MSFLKNGFSESMSVYVCDFFSEIVEAPNRLEMTYQRTQKSVLDKYKSRRKAHHLYSAAARLWANGVEWSRALQIVSEAFDAIVHEEP